jgi:hypothetical protein
MRGPLHQLSDLAPPQSFAVVHNRTRMAPEVPQLRCGASGTETKEYAWSKVNFCLLCIQEGVATFGHIDQQDYDGAAADGTPSFETCVRTCRRELLEEAGVYLPHEVCYTSLPEGLGLERFISSQQGQHERRDSVSFVTVLLPAGSVCSTGVIGRDGRVLSGGVILEDVTVDKPEKHAGQTVSVISPLFM